MFPGHWKDVADCWREVYTWSTVAKTCVQMMALASDLTAVEKDSEQCVDSDYRVEKSQKTREDTRSDEYRVEKSEKTRENTSDYRFEKREEDTQSSDYRFEKTREDTRSEVMTTKPISDITRIRSTLDSESIELSCAAMLRDIDMGLLLGLPLDDSPLTRVASLLNPLARIDNPMRDNVCNVPTMVDNKSLDIISKTNEPMNCCNFNLITSDQCNWIPFEKVYYEHIEHYKRSKKYGSSNIDKCMNCDPTLGKKFESDLDSMDKLIEDAALCSCNGYSPPKHYLTDQPLPGSIFDPNHPSLHVRKADKPPLYAFARDMYEDLVVNPVAEEAFLNERDFMERYVKRGKPVKILGLIEGKSREGNQSRYWA